MNIRAAFLCILAVSTSLVVSAQVENDDMYFNSKDRAKMQASRPMTLKSIAAEHEVATAINPTDSYSARNVNPEYISQSKVSSGATEAAPYFIPDYTPTSVNQNLSSNKNSSYYSNYNNMAMAGYNPYGMYSPYGGGYNSFYPSMYGYGNPYGYNSLYNSGWSSMISLGFGMGMGSYYGGYYPYGGSSWAMGMGYGSPYYAGYGMMSPYYGMGYGAGYGYYPHNVIIINDNNRKNNVVYGSRPSRSSDVNNMVTYNNRSSAVITDTQGRTRGSNASGRVSGDGTTSTSYYQRGWRSNPDTNSALRSSGWSTSGRSSDAGRSNSGFGRSSSSGFESSGYSRSTNSAFGGGGSNFSSGGGTRSSGGSISSGSSSGGARRGRD